MFSWLALSPGVQPCFVCLIIDVRYAVLQISWSLVVVDEGQRLKSRKAQALQALVDLHISRRLLLSGTPLQNNTAELWTLMNFVEPVWPRLLVTPILVVCVCVVVLAHAGVGFFISLAGWMKGWKCRRNELHIDVYCTGPVLVTGAVPKELRRHPVR